MKNRLIKKIVSILLLIILMFQVVCPNISFANMNIAYSKYEKDNAANSAIVHFGIECLNQVLAYEKNGIKYYTFELNEEKMKDYVQKLYDNGTFDNNTTVKFTYNANILEVDYDVGGTIAEIYFGYIKEDGSGRSMTGDEENNLKMILNSIGVSYVFVGDKTGNKDVMEGIDEGAENVNDLADNLNQGTADNNVGMEKKDSADLGGILLSPIFYLINFVADAITSNLGRIMLGNDPSFSNVTGTKVLQGNIITSIPGKSSYVEVKAELNNVIGKPQYPNIPYTPEEIFAGKIDLLSIDFISGKNAEGQTITGDWTSIRTEIAKWYQVLRMVAIIGLLSVLIYTGIKIIISANAKDKAKYKEWIINWFMAVAILFAMHLIMAFIISVTGEFSKLLNNACQGIKITGDGKGTVTNLMGLVRFMIQSEDFYKKVAYEVMYIALLVYTIKFTIVYLKRVLSMAFLTLIAPIVALTYPIDKINDGKAQGFDMWIKEYIFNALLQPMHLILYYILVGSAVSVAASNPIYGIVVLMFMTEAEKLLKRIFGFDKAGGGTVGGMAGAFAAGAIASNIKNIARMASKSSGGNGGKSGSNGSGSSNPLMDKAKEKDGAIGDGFYNPALDGESPSGGDSPRGSDQNDNSSEDGANEGESSRRRLPIDQPEENQSGDNQPGNNQSEDNQPEEHLPEEGLPATESEEEVESGIPAEESVNDDAGDEGVSEDDGSSDSINNTGIRAMAARTKDRVKNAYNEDSKRGRILRGVGSVGKSVVRPLVDMDRDKDYNIERWKRRGKKALKGAGKAAGGVLLGTAAAAVQAGISITDGKYNPLEGVATFSAGYAGGSRLTGSVAGKVVNSFNEGYYSGAKGKEDLIEKKQKEFMYSDDVHSKYLDDWGEKAKGMKELASKQLVNYGITDTKKQKQILKLAESIAGKNEPLNSAKMEAAVIRARKTSGFIDQLESQGQRSVIGDPDKQEKYIDAVIKSQNLDAKADKDKIDQIKRNYHAAFKSASQFYQVNR